MMIRLPWFSSASKEPSLNLKQLFTNFPAALIVFDIKGNLLLINQWASTLLHVSSQTGTYKRLVDLPYYLNPLKEALSPWLQPNSLSPEITVRKELSLQLPEQTEPTLIGYSIREEQIDAYGKVRVLVFADISQFRASETALQQRHLEAYQSRKITALNTLISQLHRELHNPFLTLSLDAELLKLSLGKLSIEDERYSLLHHRIDRIQQSTERAMTLVNKLLHYSKPIVLECSKVDIDYFLQGLVMEWKHGSQLPEWVSLYYEPPLQTYYVHMDTAHIRRVLEALFMNALEAVNETGHLQLTVRVEAVPQPQETLAPAWNNPQGYVRVSVTDNGKGIYPEHLERLLEPFFTTKQSKSVGLGLCHVYKTIEKHGGHLSYTSTVGKGSTFGFTLPIATKATAT
ncbi:MAG: sensor histidine kinase [Vampirovibrionales bacterium]